MIQSIAESTMTTNVTLFDSCFHPELPIVVPLDEIIGRIRSDDLKSATSHIRSIFANAGGLTNRTIAKKAIDGPKKALPAFSMTGVFTYRHNDKLTEHNGIIQGDIDGLTNDQKSELRAKLIACQHIVFVFESPSGCGLKIGVMTHRMSGTTDAEYKTLWHPVSAWIEKTFGYPNDTSTKDVSRLAFMCYDPDVYYNPDATPLSVQKMSIDPEDMFHPDHPIQQRNEPDESTDSHRDVLDEIDVEQEPERSESMLTDAEKDTIWNRVKQIRSVSGDHGNDGLMKVCRILVSGYGLSESLTWTVLSAWNAKVASPEWSRKELAKALATIRATKSRFPIGCLWENAEMDNEEEVKHGGNGIGKGVKITYFTNTTERKPDWLWSGFLLRGATHVLGGKQGSSKGLATVDIAARLTRGDKMPDGSGGGKPLKVLFVTREDDPEMTLFPRLRVAKADMSMVAWSHGDFEDGTPITSMAMGAAAIEVTVVAEQIDVVIIDPLGAWIEDDANNGQQIRAVIDPMNRMARRVGCAVLFVAHIRKAAAEDPMDAFAGSVQITAACRIAVLISPTTDGRERIFEVAKTNFRKPDAPMMYRLCMTSTDRDEPPMLVWRSANQDDQAAAAASQRGSSPIVPADIALEHMGAEHRPFDEVARSVHKSVISKVKGATLQGVKDALAELITAGRAYEGRSAKNGRTIGRGVAPVIKTATDLAADYWSAHPQATVRQVADATGCSTTQAFRAHKMILFRSSVTSVDVAPT